MSNIEHSNLEKTSKKKFLKEKKSLKNISTKLKNKKEDFDNKTIENTNNNLQQIEEKIKTQKEEKDIKELKNEIIKKKNKPYKKTSKEDFFEIRNNEGLTITDFDSIFDNIIYDFDELKKKFLLLTLQNIAQKIKHNRLEKQKEFSRNKNKEGLQTKKENLTPLEERKKAVSDIIFESIDNDNINGTNQNLTENIELIAYIIQDYDKLDDKKKKKFMKWFQELLAYYMEGKIIEAYEITIQNGQIIITGKGENGQTITIKLNEKKIGKETMLKIKKILKNKEKILFNKSPKNNKEIGKNQIFQKIEIGNTQTHKKT